MTSELHRHIRRNTLPAAGALLVLALTVALALACGGGGGASPECLDTLYSGRMDEGTREQLSRPVSSMDDAARLATIKALSHQGSYGTNAGSAECGEFVSELEAWEDTDDGREWHEENGEEIASVVMSFLGVAQCQDGVDYGYLKNFAGDLKLLHSQVRVGDESFSKSGDYGYGATRELRLEESFEDRDTFFRFDWDLECTITADVDTRKRTVANIEVLEAELMQDGFTVGSYTK